MIGNALHERRKENAYAKPLSIHLKIEIKPEGIT